MIKRTILISLACWFISGVVLGLFTTLLERTPDFNGIKKSGCVYKSVGSSINPGYVFSCEIFRQRFEIEGFKK